MLPMMPQRNPGPQDSAVVDVGGAQHILGNEVIDLARHGACRRLATWPGISLLRRIALLADRRIELRLRAGSSLLRSLSADDLDQRDQVRRIERMADDAALRMRCCSPTGFRSS